MGKDPKYKPIRVRMTPAEVLDETRSQSL